MEHTTVPQMCVYAVCCRPAARLHNSFTKLLPAQFVLLILHLKVGCDAVQNTSPLYHVQYYMKIAELKTQEKSKELTDTRNNAACCCSGILEPAAPCGHKKAPCQSMYARDVSGERPWLRTRIVWEEK